MKGSQNQRSILSFFGASANQKSKKSPVKEVISNGSSQKHSLCDSPVKKKSGNTDDCKGTSDISELRNATPSNHVKKRKRSSSPEPNTSGEQNNAIPNGDSDVGFSADTVPPLRKTARKQMSRQPDSVETHQVEVIKNIKSSPQRKGEKSNTTPDAPVQGNKPRRTNCLDNFIFRKASHRNEKKDEVKASSNGEMTEIAKEDAASINNNVSESIATTKDETSVNNDVSKSVVTGKDATSVKNDVSKSIATSVNNNESESFETAKEISCTTEKAVANESMEVDEAADTTSAGKSVDSDSVEASRSETTQAEHGGAKKLRTPKSKNDKASPKSRTPNIKTDKGSPKLENSKLESPKLESPKLETSKIETPKRKADRASRRLRTPKSKSDKVSPKSETSNKSPKSESSQKFPDSESTKKSPKSENTKKSPKSESTKKSPKSESSKKSPESKSKNSPESKSPKNSPESKSTKTSPESKSTKNSPKSESKKSPESSSTKKSPSSASTDTQKPKTVPKNPFLLASAKPEKESYNPSKSHYHPIDDATWKKGEPVPFCVFSKTLELIEDTSGRLKTIEILSNFLRSVILLTPEDLLYCIYLCLNKVAPSFESIELGVGEIYVCRVIAQATGRSVSMIKSDLAEKGDLGIVAEHSKSNQRMMFQPARLTVKKVFAAVKEIALMSGQASQTKKMDKMKSMFVSCKGSEARFLIRFFCGKLRIGLAEQSVLQAIAQACFLTPPGQEHPPEVVNAGKGLSPENLKGKIEEHTHILKTTYCECPTFDAIVPILLEHGLKDLPKHCKLEPGIPLKPMLAHPTKGVAEVLKRFSKCKFTCEFKYDGERAQIHLKEDGSISVFSRNQENNTTKYPDIIGRLKDSLGPDVKSCIIDSEAVAYDVENKKILPFQILSTRKKKDVNEGDIKVQVCVFPFDLLYLNGRNLVTEPLEVRRNFLRENFKEVEGQFCFAKSMDSTNTEDIEEFLEESIKGSCEGLMVKSLDVDATYEIAKRSHNWLKLKKDYLEGVGDTIDVVVIGGFLGKGKRTGTYGGFLLACYDPDNEEFQSLCKLGTGLTEDVLQKHTEYLKEKIIEGPKSYYRFDPCVSPDHWFDAVQVWEIKCADLSISPVHKAAIGIVDPEKGISLRFPRFLRIRDDKSAENATSSHQIAELYRNQDQIKSQLDSANVDNDFY